MPLANTADTFRATASDPDPGDAVSLSWAFDDGAKAGGASVTHSFAGPGAHTATVTATDSSGLSATATVTVDVPGAPNTKIRKAKIVAGRDEAIFRFDAVGVASGFECELRRRHSNAKPKFKSCRSPKTYKHLKPGRYTFEVRGLNPAGHDPTPAKREFRLR
jgi:PKD repeat protein